MKASAKIIVVDDERRICRNVEKILSGHNYETVHAVSADEALQIMAKNSFSLLISDIVMPGMNGLELLKQVKTNWPQTKAIMMTAYASTDTAARAIRLGALDYLPKPFTPDELRTTVELALAEKLVEAPTPETERNHIDTKAAEVSADKAIIDVDIPFERGEVVKYAGEDYAASLGPSDMPGLKRPAPEISADFCSVGNMVCEMFQKLGGTCKAGKKSGECPQLKARARKTAKGKASFDGRVLIGVDMPFRYEDVESITGPEYVENLNRDGMSFIPYAELKKRTQHLKTWEPLPAEQRGSLEKPVASQILIIDDETSVNHNIRKILLKKGLRVDQAFTKSDALEMIEQTEYKLILLDLRIPGVKGLELLEAIRDKRPRTRVIIITGYASIETAKETARLGAVDYLAKPFTPDELRSATDQAFRLAA